MSRLIVFALIPAVVFGALEFSAPVLCPDATSEWWTSPSGCLGSEATLYAAWAHTGLGSQDGGIYFARSLDTNRTWSSDITIHFWDPTWIHAEYKRPKLESTGDSLYCLYWLRPEHASSTWHVYCSRSDDRGASWNIFEASVSGDNSGTMNGHDFAVGPDGAINLVFATQPTIYQWSRTYFSRSTNGGLSFSLPLMLPSNPDSVGATWPSLAISGGGAIYVAIAHYMNSSRRICFAVSDDNGASFDTTYLDDLGDGGYPMLRIGPRNNLYLCWETTDDAIGASRSTDGGTTWSAPFTVADDNFSWDFEATDERLLVVWNSPDWEPWHRVSEDGGTTWSEPKRTWLANPFPGDWLTYKLDVRDAQAAIWMHPEPGNVEGTYCANAVWPLGIADPWPADPFSERPDVLARPNPFRQKTVLACDRAIAEPLQLAIHDASGRLLRRLTLAPAAVWDGTDDAGSRLPAGVYFASADGHRPTRLVLGD